MTPAQLAAFRLLTMLPVRTVEAKPRIILVEPRWAPPNTVRRALRLRDEGFTVHEIAQIIGEPRSTVGRWLKESK